MGANQISLSGALFTTTQQWMLALLFGQQNRPFFGNQLISLTSSGSGADQRELKRLSDSGLALSRKIGNQHYLQANLSAPIFNELLQIVKNIWGRRAHAQDTFAL